MKDMTAIVAIMAVFTLAVCFIMLGSISVELMARLEIDENQFGTLISLFSLSCLIAQLFIGFMVDKFGHKPLAVSGFLIAGAAILLLAFSTSYALVRLATLLLGVGAICCFRWFFSKGKTRRGPVILVVDSLDWDLCWCPC
ncbi:MAG: MFS transporter [Planctomycetota bacterium]|jgi:AAHS family benzoate transporter-like MFS transporter